MNSIAAKMPGTTVAQKFNQSLSRLCGSSTRPLGRNKRSVAFLPARLWHSGGGSLAPAPPMRGPNKKIRKPKGTIISTGTF
jgi:hypothetical protein